MEAIRQGAIKLILTQKGLSKLGELSTFPRYYQLFPLRISYSKEINQIPLWLGHGLIIPYLRSIILSKGYNLNIQNAKIEFRDEIIFDYDKNRNVIIIPSNEAWRKAYLNEADPKS